MSTLEIVQETLELDGLSVQVDDVAVSDDDNPWTRRGHDWRP